MTKLQLYGPGEQSRSFANATGPEKFFLESGFSQAEWTAAFASVPWPAWLLVPARFDDKNKLKVMKDFLQWMVTDGQKMTQELLYAPLPEEVVAKEQAAFNKVR